MLGVEPTLTGWQASRSWPILPDEYAEWQATMAGRRYQLCLPLSIYSTTRTVQRLTSGTTRADSFVSP